MQGAARRRRDDDIGVDLEEHAAQAIAGGTEAVGRLMTAILQDGGPVTAAQVADAIAAVHMWGAHLEDIRRAIADLKLTVAMEDVVKQAVREAGSQDRDGRKPRPIAPRREGLLRIVQG